MSKFKVGDRVLMKAFGDSEASKKLAGRICRIREKLASVDGYRLEEEGNEPHGGVWEREIELVEESELERLVRVANEGLRALGRLNDAHSDKLEEGMDNSFSAFRGWGGVSCYTIRIKPAPKRPDPITIGPGWEVKLSDQRHTAMIGCHAFDASWLKAGLAELCQLGVTQTKGTTPLVATRSGVRYGGHEISWADADRLLAWLEEALK